MGTIAKLLAGVALAYFVSGEANASIIYNVDLTIGAGSVTGFIETDGTLGALDASNIINDNLLISDGTHSFDTVGGLFFGNVAGDLVGTTTQLSFNFSGPPNGYLWFGNVGATVCFETSTNCIGRGIASGEELSIWNYGSYEYTSVSGTGVIGTVSSVPEPSTWALALVGFVSLGFVGYRRSNLKSTTGLTTSALARPFA